MDVLFRDGSFAGVRPQATHIELQERIAFGDKYTLWNRLVIDRFQYAELGSKAVIYVAALTQEDFKLP